MSFVRCSLAYYTGRILQWHLAGAGLMLGPFNLLMGVQSKERWGREVESRCHSSRVLTDSVPIIAVDFEPHCVCKVDDFLIFLGEPSFFCWFISKWKPCNGKHSLGHSGLTLNSGCHLTATWPFWTSHKEGTINYATHTCWLAALNEIG